VRLLWQGFGEWHVSYSLKENEVYSYFYVSAESVLRLVPTFSFALPAFDPSLGCDSSTQLQLGHCQSWIVELAGAVLDDLAPS